LIDVASLPVISGDAPAPPAPMPAASQSALASAPAPTEQPAEPDAFAPAAVAPELDIFATIERLAALKAKGILTDAEFSAKKTELLARL
jgi:hypothetical protein